MTGSCNGSGAAKDVEKQSGEFAVMPKKKVPRKRSGSKGIPEASDRLAANRAAAKASALAARQTAELSSSSSCSEEDGSDEDTSHTVCQAHGAVEHDEVSDAPRPKRMKKKLKKLSVNLSMCKYRVIRDTVEWLGWRTTENETEWHLWWTDMSVGEERCMRLRRPQKLNHFPGMTEIAHKCKMARNLNRLRGALPEFYDFHPETFNLPVDYLAFEQAALGDLEQRKGKGGKSNKSYIIKPDDGACGVGIFITRKPASVPAKLACVAQRYLNRPLLIDNRKFDLRLYVLVTSMTPLRVYLFPEGLARFATEEYEPVTTSNMGKRYMHLTNYSVNRSHKDFETDDSADAASGSKRSLAAVRAWLANNGYDVHNIWTEIEKVIVKTLLAVEPYVSHTYRTCIASNHDCVGFSCFDLLGFDVMLDHKAKPWIIEVNEMPSFETAAAIDVSTKTAVLYEALRLICPTVQELRLLTEMTKAVKVARAAKAVDRRRAAATDEGTSPAGPKAAKDAKDKDAAGRDDAVEHDIRAQLVKLRLEQEAYERTRFRLIYPLTDPVQDGRCGKAAAAHGCLDRGGASLPSRYAQEPDCIELGVAEELWEFAAITEDAARQRDARLQAEYAKCSAAASEIFENAMWLRLGKAPSKQGAPQTQMERRGVPPSMVQAGQGALLSRLRHHQQQLCSEHMMTAEGKPDWAGKEKMPTGDSSALADCGSKLVAGAAGAGSVRGSRTSSLDSSPASRSPASPCACSSDRGPEKTGDEDRVWLGGDELGRSSLRRASAAARVQTARDTGRNAEPSHAQAGAPMLSVGGGQGSNAVLQRLALLRKELQDKRAADDAGMTLSLTVGKASGGGATRRHAQRGSWVADGSRRSEGIGSIANCAQRRLGNDDRGYAPALSSKPIGHAESPAVSQRLASAGVDGRQSQPFSIHVATGQSTSRWTADLEEFTQGAGRPERGACGLTAPPSREGERERRQVREAAAVTSGAGEAGRPRLGSSKGGVGVGEVEGGSSMETSSWTTGAVGGGKAVGSFGGRKEGNGLPSTASHLGALPKQNTWGNVEAVRTEGSAGGWAHSAPGKMNAQGRINSVRAHGAGLFQALEAGGQADSRRPGSRRRAHEVQLLHDARVRTPSAPPKLDM